LVLRESLCVFLSGSALMYSQNAGKVLTCARAHGVIDFKGDWCSATNARATAECSDALRFEADFLASAAVIHWPGNQRRGAEAQRHDEEIDRALISSVLRLCVSAPLR
jgi:hypothetical protein